MIRCDRGGFWGSCQFSPARLWSLSAARTPTRSKAKCAPLCEWPLRRPRRAFRGAPFWLAYVAAAALIVAGLGLTLWPGRPKGQARLTVKGPRLHQYPPQRPQTTNFCRMWVHNRGPAAANNVQIRLLDIAPRPKHSAWPGDYPYPVARVGAPIDASGCEIKRGSDELFQIASGWRDSRGEFMTGLDTKSPFHNPTPIAPDERWLMTYEVTADNAKPIQFLLEMFVQNGAVAMKRKNGRGRPSRVPDATRLDLRSF